MIDYDSRCTASPITDKENELINHVARMGYFNVDQLTSAIEEVVLSVRRATGIQPEVLVVALMLDKARRNFPSTTKTVDHVIEQLRTAYA